MRNKDEDRFAELLLQKHQNLIDRKAEENGGPLDSDDSMQDRIDEVLPVLDLLHEIDRDELERVQGSFKNDTQSIGETREGQKLPAETPLARLEKISRFEIGDSIGSGGFGTVVRAFDPELKRAVAIKFPKLECALSQEARERFDRESRAAASLDHPNIVTVYESGCQSGISYIVAQLVEGENLADALATGRNFSARESAELVSAIADAIEHAHQRGVIHRDIKPSNILLEEETKDNRQRTIPKITDFGMAWIRDDCQDITKTGSALGTPKYMAPEQAQSNYGKIDQRTDIYGLGAVLYELLTGDAPFSGATVVQTLRAICDREAKSPRLHEPSIPVDLEAICLKCLEKQSKHRYSSARELQLDLQRFLDAKPVQARPITSIDRLVRWSRRNRALSSSLITLAIVFLAATITTLVLWLRSNDLQQQSQQADQLAEQRLEEHEQAIDRIYRRVSMMPEFESREADQARREMLAEINSLYTKLEKQNPENDRIRKKKFKSLLKLVNMKSTLGDDENTVQYANDVLNLAKGADEDESSSVQQRVDALLAAARANFVTKQNDQGTKLYEQAIQLARTQFERIDDPTDQERIRFAITLSEGSELASALGFITISNQLAMESLAVWENSELQWIEDDQAAVSLFKSMLSAGKALIQAGKKKRCQLVLEAAIELAENSLSKPHFNSPEVQFELCEAYRISAFSVINQPEVCQQFLIEATRIIGNLIADHPNVVKYRVRLINVQYYDGLVMYLESTTKIPLDQELMQTALERFEKSVSYAESMIELFPDQKARLVASARNSLLMSGSAAGRLKRRDLELQLLNRAIDLYDSVYQTTESRRDYSLLLVAHSNLGSYYLNTKQYDLAIEKFEYTVAEYEKLLKFDPLTAQVERFLSGDCEYLSNAYAAQDRYEDALKVFEQSMRHMIIRNVNTMKGKKAGYLTHVGRYDEAGKSFAEFSKYQFESKKLPKILADAARVLQGLESNSAESDEAKKLKDQVIQAALKASRTLKVENPSQLQMLLQHERIKILGETPEFKRWRNNEPPNE